MHGYFVQLMKALGAEPHVFVGAFTCNAALDPDSDNNSGPPGLRAFTTTYAATGQFTVTLPAGLNCVGTPTVLVSAEAASLSEHFEVMTVGAFDTATRSFVVQAHRAGTGREVPAGGRIHFALIFNNSTGG